MREFAGNLSRKLNSFRHLGFEFSEHKLPEERESEKPMNVAEIDEANTVEIGETSLSPAKVHPVCKMHQRDLKVSGQGWE